MGAVFSNGNKDETGLTPVRSSRDYLKCDNQSRVTSPCAGEGSSCTIRGVLRTVRTDHEVNDYQILCGFRVDGADPLLRVTTVLLTAVSSMAFVIPAECSSTVQHVCSNWVEGLDRYLQ